MPPFDPNLPANGSPNSSAEMRGQFMGLKELIDAIQTITGAHVDGVTTANPGDPATVSLMVMDGVLHFTFGIPQGQQGGQGEQGSQGNQGAQGVQGEQGIQGFQGEPGEVTNAALTAGLALKAQNPSTVNTLPSGAPANYDQVQQQELIDKVNELINALRV